MALPTKDQVKSGATKTFHAIGTAANTVDKMTQYNSSIAGLAKENIFEFPVFISDSVELDYATAVNTLIEQVYASYLQAAISINPVVDAETVKQNKQFAAFKTNANRYLECTDMEYAHDACHNIIQEGDRSWEFSMISIGDKDIDFINEYCNHDDLSEFDHYFQEASTNVPNDKNKTNNDEKDAKISAPKILDEGKINKLNTMKPLMMNVSLKVASADGNISAPIDYVVGVKTFIRRIDNDILPEVAQYPMKEMNKLSRKAKWKAGEIKFLEYIFKTKEKKQTAIDSKDPKRKWYRRLYELAHSQNDSVSTVLKTSSKRDIVNIKASLKANGSLIPNATIVISKADVDNIKEKTDIDMLKGSTAIEFCRELFLMGLIVVDVDSSSIKMLIPDLHNDYEIHSIASVNKQIGMLDTLGVKTSDIKRLLG